MIVVATCGRIHSCVALLLCCRVSRHMEGTESKAEHISTCLTAVSPMQNDSAAEFASADCVPPRCCSHAQISADSNFVLSNPPHTVPGHQNIVVFTAGWAAKFVPLFGRILVDIAFKGQRSGSGLDRYSALLLCTSARRCSCLVLVVCFELPLSRLLRISSFSLLCCRRVAVSARSAAIG